MKVAGLPHSEIPGSKPVDGSPELIAVFRVLHSLLMPRHPSCARIRLARNLCFKELLDLALRVVILFNLQLPLVKEQCSPFQANERVVYQKRRLSRKGEFEDFLINF